MLQLGNEDTLPFFSMDHSRDVDERDDDAVRCTVAVAIRREADQKVRQPVVTVLTCRSRGCVGSERRVAMSFSSPGKSRRLASSVIGRPRSVGRM